MNTKLASIKSVEFSFDCPNDEPPNGLVRTRQVHGSAFVNVFDQPLASLCLVEADALVTEQKRPIGVQTADCIPILISTLSGDRIAAVHAGWRGVQLGILPRVVDEFTVHGVKPSELVFALGPSIRSCCFEVSQEIVDLFEKSWGPVWRKYSKSVWHLGKPMEGQDSEKKSAKPQGADLWVDLIEIAKIQLLSKGAVENQIDVIDECTYCGPVHRASHRRSTHNGTLPAGRQWSWIRRVD